MAFAFAAGAIETGNISRDDLSVYAADEKEENPGKEELPKVIADIRRRVNIPAVANDCEWKSKLLDENISYRITWKDPEDGTKLEVYYWNGLIYGYWDESVYPIRPSLVKLSPEEQEKLAMSYIYKLNPDLEGDIVLERRGDYYDLWGDVTFDIKRLEQGLEVAENAGWVTVNRDNGELMSLRLYEWWAEAEFSDSKKALTREEIYDIYTSRFPQDAEYELYSSYKYDSEKDVRTYKIFTLPLYKSNAIETVGENVLDAFSGEYTDYYKDIKESDDSWPWDWDGLFAVDTCGSGFYDDDYNIITEATDGERKVFYASKEGQKQISGEGALEIVKDDSFIKLDSSLSLVKDELKYTRDEKNDVRLLRCLKFERKTKHNRADSVYLTVYLDAYTGQITKFSKSYYYGENSKTRNTTPVAEKSAVSTAKEAMNRFMGEWGREYKFEGNIAGLGTKRKDMDGCTLTPEDNTAVVEFVRYVNGIPARFDKVYITVDSRGEVLGFDYTYHDIDFPKGKVLSQSEAFGKVFEKDPPKFYYKGFADTNAKPHTYLVYSFNESYYINAITGERCTEQGKPYYTEKAADNNPGYYTDVSGHKYEKEISELYKYGVRFGDDKKLRPDDPITITEFDDLCNITDVSNFGTWQVYRDKVTDPETGETHYEDDPKIYTNLTYGELARIFAVYYRDYDDIYPSDNDPSRHKQPYKNVTRDNPNYLYIAIAKEKGYIRSGVNFDYDKTITRGECMKLFYDYIANEEEYKPLYEIIKI